MGESRVAMAPSLLMPIYSGSGISAKSANSCYISSVFGSSKRFRYDFHLLNWDASFLSVILNLLSNPAMNCCR